LENPSKELGQLRSALINHLNEGTSYMFGSLSFFNGIVNILTWFILHFSDFLCYIYISKWAKKAIGDFILKMKILA